MFKKIIKLLFSNLKIFTASFSNEVFKEPLKSEEEEKLLLIKDNNKDARSKLIEHNLRLVAHIVKKYSDNSYEQDDLLSIGTIGLIKAIDSYKLNHGVKLTTYASRCIENEILMYFRTNNKNLKNVSLYSSIGYDKDGEEINIIDILKEESVDFLDEVIKKDNIKLLKDYIKILDDREKDIINRRYNLNETQKKISKDLKISRSYVSRIEKRALTKILKEYMKKDLNYFFFLVYKLKIVLY